MGISVDAAGVLATIIPIGLLILGVEIRGVEPVVATARVATVALWLLGAVLLGGLVIGFVAEYILVGTLLSGEPVTPLGGLVVYVGLSLIGTGSFWLLLYSLASTLGIVERLGRRAAAGTMASPRRVARQVAYVRKHHPRTGQDR